MSSTGASLIRTCRSLASCPATLASTTMSARTISVTLRRRTRSVKPTAAVPLRTNNVRPTKIARPACSAMMAPAKLKGRPANSAPPTSNVRTTSRAATASASGMARSLMGLRVITIWRAREVTVQRLRRLVTISCRTSASMRPCLSTISRASRSART